MHADLRLANLIADGDDIQVIDFDDCGFSWYLYDLACALTFLEARPDVDELVASWVAGYREVEELSAEDEAEIPTFLMLRRSCSCSVPRPAPRHRARAGVPRGRLHARVVRPRRALPGPLRRV